MLKRKSLMAWSVVKDRGYVELTYCQSHYLGLCNRFVLVRWFEPHPAGKGLGPASHRMFCWSNWNC